MGDTLSGMMLGEFLRGLGSRTPTPGGGAAAGVAGALGASVARMVVEFSIGKKSLAAHEGRLLEARGVLDDLAARFVRLGDEDAEAYGVLNAMQRLPEEDPGRAGLAAALERCVRVPGDMVRSAVELAGVVESLVGRSARGLRSDLAIAAVLSEATASAGAWNVGINLAGMEDEAARARIEAETARALEAVRSARARVEEACR